MPWLATMEALEPVALQLVVGSACTLDTAIWLGKKVAPPSADCV